MNWFYNLSIRLKLLLGFGFTVFLAAVIAVIGYLNIQAMSDEAHMIYGDRLVPIQELGTAEARLLEIAIIGQELASGNEDAALAEALSAHAQMFEASIDTVAMTRLDNVTKSKLEAVRTEWADFKPHINQAREAVTSASVDLNAAQARALTDEARRLVTIIGEIVDHEQALAEQADESIYSAQRAATFELFGGSGLALVLGIGIAFFIARVITRPVRELEGAAQQVTDGNLEAQADIQSKDELGRLSASFNGMVETIRNALHEAEEQSRRAEETAQEARQAQQEIEEQQRALRDSVQHILDRMNRLADGDLTVEAAVDGREGAIRELFIGFNEVVATIRDMLIRVDEAVETTSSAAGQISGASTQLAAASEEQSAQADELAAAMEEMSRTIVDNAEGATRTANIAKESGDTARENGKVILQTVEKMRAIGDVVEQSAETVNRLGASSEEIGEIVATIDEIADQTNLLALNAAIEAARAGEHGQGFAVVADEVRQLAERTAQATGKIETMIRSVQDETESAVRSIEKGRGEVQTGIELADEAGSAFESIIDGVESVAEQVDSIAAATEEQSTTSEQISQTVESISTVSSEAARGVGEVAQSATQLDELTEDLAMLLDQFELGIGKANAGRQAPTHEQDGETPAAIADHPAEAVTEVDLSDTLDGG